MGLLQNHIPGSADPAQKPDHRVISTDPLAGRQRFFHFPVLDVDHDLVASSVFRDGAKHSLFFVFPVLKRREAEQVIVSQSLDWESLTYQIMIPIEKTEAFKAHCNENTLEEEQNYNIQPEKEKSHPITIHFDKKGRSR